MNKRIKKKKQTFQLKVKELYESEVSISYNEYRKNCRLYQENRIKEIHSNQFFKDLYPWLNRKRYRKYLF